MEFIKGVDVSMIQELEEHGAKYFLNGKEQDVFSILKDCSVNLVRLRLWNHPYTKNGEAYGGGTNDIKTTEKLAERIISHGMSFMLDFQYSDFWADPAKQFKPKAWEKMGMAELKESVYRYTSDTLYRLKGRGLLPSYIQIGNEITNGLLWPEGRVENLQNMAELLRAGIQAAKEAAPEAKILLHLDFGTDNAMYRRWFADIEPYQLDFDIIGMSYYPYWNGTLKELVENMEDISRTFGKEVMIAETAIGYTTDDLGCSGMVFSEELAEKTKYPATEEGQEAFLRDLCQGVRSVAGNRGVGVLYWEAAWLPFPECAWAGPAGREYMHDKAEAGNSWANQALFDAQGNANRALLNLKDY